MTRPPIDLMPDEPEEDRVDALGESYDQTKAGEAHLALGAEHFLRLPWRDVDDLVGGIAPGDVWFVGAFSGNGKTTFLLNLVHRLLAQGKAVYYVGTESRPQILRTQLACLRVGVYAGDVLSGASRSWEHWPFVRQQLVRELEAQRFLSEGNRLMVAPFERVDTRVLANAYRDAALCGADLLIVDHIDHVDATHARSAFDASRAASNAVLDLARANNMRTMAATQLNNEALRGDRLGLHSPPQPHHVYMGGHKRQIAWGMLGLYRPMRDDLSPDDLKAAKAGTLDPSAYLEPDCMGITVMKHRNFGSRENRRCRLRFDMGRLDDIPERDRYATGYDARGPRV